jgi:hypothetical protein
VLITMRGAPGLSVPIELDRCVDEDRLRWLLVGPLTVGATHHLLKDRVGLDLSRPELVRLNEVTGGNPFFVVELGRELVRTNTRPTAAAVVRVPASLRMLLDDRLARLPTDTGDVLLVVAASARPTVELLAAAQGDKDRVVHALDAAVTEGVIELDDARVRFSHPLHASVCYQQAPLWKRRAVHRALAAAVTDVEERARHLALAVEGPDATSRPSWTRRRTMRPPGAPRPREPSCSSSPPRWTRATPRRRANGGCRRPSGIAWPATASGRRQSWTSCSPKRHPECSVLTSCSNWP